MGRVPNTDETRKHLAQWTVRGPLNAGAGLVRPIEVRETLYLKIH